ncbi:hypothetical protein LTR95_007683 [Oleoguttula sp. CCFEE 5521]
MARRFIEQGNVRTVLLCAAAKQNAADGRDANDGLPSWVPDWHGSTIYASDAHRKLPSRTSPDDSEYDDQLPGFAPRAEWGNATRHLEFSISGSTLRVPMLLLDPENLPSYPEGPPTPGLKRKAYRCKYHQREGGYRAATADLVYGHPRSSTSING